ncbi:outer membrane protein assembly factor BamB [Candidatus Njordibacter sp. Uisw_039]|jgi:outer membrane protein assembly factor BamB|uniref:outer membrane protein assembly factor BamB n=1 Tax=Candidatus Njordibacter sp. Uisw_039 TaxID=3230972 RepID=UPI003D59F64B|tara:strand:+ start:12487 stop:13632 length:1146 start_codon:yes stop_codon:yes gene_type:complete
MIARPLKLLIICLTLIAVSGCSSSGGNLPDPAPLNAINQQVQLVQHWSVAVGKGDVKSSSVMQPLLSGSAIFAASGQQLGSFNVDTGEVNWKIDLAEKVTAGVGHINQQLFVVTQSGKLVAVSSADGSILWQVNTSSEALAAPQANSKIVVVQTVDGKVSAYAVKEGKFQWSYAANLPSLTLRGTSTPLVNESYTYAGFASGKLVALDNQVGSVVWQKSIGAAIGRSEIERLVDIDGALTLVDDLLYVSSYQGNIAAIDALTGTVRWQQPVSSISGTALVGDAILVVDAQDTVLAYDRERGHVLWQNDALKHRLLTSPMGLANQALVVDTEGYAHVLQLSDGEFIGRQKLAIKGARIGSKSYQDNIFLLSLDGRLTRLGLK